MIAAVLLSASGTATAQVAIPAGGTWSLGGATLDLGGSDLQVAGSFGATTGSIQNAINVSVSPGGNLGFGSGSITMSGDWSNLGMFSAGSGQVNFVDGALALSNITGNSTFFNLSFVSTTGKAYVFQSGSTQTIENQLQILGTASAGIQIESTSPFASMDLLAGGSQNIDFVGVSNVHAAGQPLATTLTNDGGSGNATGWFGSGGAGSGPVAVLPAPTLSPWALLLLGLGLLGGASRFRQRLHRLNRASEI